MEKHDCEKITSWKELTWLGCTGLAGVESEYLGTNHLTLFSSLPVPSFRSSHWSNLHDRQKQRVHSFNVELFSTWYNVLSGDLLVVTTLGWK
jgi:hypothetical protein